MHRFEKPQLAEMNFICRSNIMYDKKRESDIVYVNEDGFRGLEEIQNKGIESNSIIADPLFKDAENYDFTLSENSPAFTVGFKLIDMSDVGVRK